mmetsp:Transcript_61105/g.137543  ORF Transcript_61105/g.137543 Transcript_61105/m.137543 type:complete len:231 (-) Transcript_61105:814-1506(-)
MVKIHALAEVDHDAQHQLNEHDRQGLRREPPRELLDVDQGQEDPQAEGVVHHGRAHQAAQRVGHRLGGALLGVVVRSHQLTGVGGDRRQDEGHVERRDTRAHAYFRQQVHHRIGEDEDQEGANGHLVEGSNLDALLLLLRLQVSKILGHILLLFLVVIVLFALLAVLCLLVLVQVLVGVDLGLPPLDKVLLEVVARVQGQAQDARDELLEADEAALVRVGGVEHGPLRLL